MFRPPAWDFHSSVSTTLCLPEQFDSFKDFPGLHRGIHGYLFPGFVSTAFLFTPHIVGFNMALARFLGILDWYLSLATLDPSIQPNWLQRPRQYLLNSMDSNGTPLGDLNGPFLEISGSKV